MSTRAKPSSTPRKKTKSSSSSRTPARRKEPKEEDEAAAVDSDSEGELDDGLAVKALPTSNHTMNAFKMPSLSVCPHISF